MHLPSKPKHWTKCKYPPHQPLFYNTTPLRYYILISVIMINMIAGIIIDSFGELRAQHAAALAKDEAGGAGRRLQLSPAPLRWSDPSTWGGTVPNSSTPIVYIPNGTHILLDTSIYVRIWVIEGILSFADESDLHLEAEAILVNHGELHIGSSG